MSTVSFSPSAGNALGAYAQRPDRDTGSPGSPGSQVTLVGGTSWINPFRLTEVLMANGLAHDAARAAVNAVASGRAVTIDLTGTTNRRAVLATLRGLGARAY